MIAPGMAVCSGRAEEARFPAGSSCGTGTHANGDPLYMSLSGTSRPRPWRAGQQPSFESTSVRKLA